MIYQQDINEISHFDFEILGTYRASGNKWANHEDVIKETRSKAAELGATHVIRAYSDTTQRDTRPTYYHTSCIGNTCNTNPIGGGTISLPEGGFVFVWVKQNEWQNMPEHLRPTVDELECLSVGRRKEIEQGRKSKTGKG
ncbi:MAG: hypothetical protein IPJ88_04895 [Myxococcales bacterium]|nr:MAG: hypothetical protein IPJ88_04895 [Myxococcales bacterium]